MFRNREDLSRIFSKKLIDDEVKRVKEATDGTVLFSMETWERDDWVVSILGLAEVKYHIIEANGMADYVKGEEPTE